MIDGIVDAKSVAAQDPHTVRVTLKTPFQPFLHVLPWLAVVNSKLVEAHKAATTGRRRCRPIPRIRQFKLRRAETGNL